MLGNSENFQKLGVRTPPPPHPVVITSLLKKYIKKLKKMEKWIWNYWKNWLKSIKLQLKNDLAYLWTNVTWFSFRSLFFVTRIQHVNFCDRPIRYIWCFYFYLSLLSFHIFDLLWFFFPLCDGHFYHGMDVSYSYASDIFLWINRSSMIWTSFHLQTYLFK